MTAGGYFGDIDIIYKRQRTFTVRSHVDTDFLTLSKQIFEDVLVVEYPEVFQEMAVIAFEREKRIRLAKK